MSRSTSPCNPSRCGSQTRRRQRYGGLARAPKTNQDTTPVRPAKTYRAGRIRALPPARGLQAASVSERESTNDWAVGPRTMKRRKRLVITHIFLPFR